MKKVRNTKQILNKSISSFQIITLIIAIIGGVFGGIPGIFNLWDKYFGNPRFEVMVSSIIVSGSSNIGSSVGDKNSLIFMIASITNNTEKPIYPEKILCFIKNKNSWNELKPTLIPNNLKFDTQGSNAYINFENLTERDLARFSGRLDKNNPIRGVLLYTTNELTKEQLMRLFDSNQEIKFQCIDISNKQYEFKTMFKGETFQDAHELPKYGLKIKPLIDSGKK